MRNVVEVACVRARAHLQAEVGDVKLRVSSRLLVLTLGGASSH